MVPRLFITRILLPASRGGDWAMGTVVGKGMDFFPALRGVLVCGGFFSR
ncbi:MAG: hypothetical protein RLY31_13 [Bacteroidota bacterium]|jgi:hypothetical protein